MRNVGIHSIHKQKAKSTRMNTSANYGVHILSHKATVGEELWWLWCNATGVDPGRCSLSEFYIYYIDRAYFFSSHKICFKPDVVPRQYVISDPALVFLTNCLSDSLVTTN